MSKQEENIINDFKSMSKEEKENLKNELQKALGIDMSTLKSSLAANKTMKEIAQKLSDDDKKKISELLQDKKSLQNFIESGELKKKFQELKGEK